MNNFDKNAENLSIDASIHVNNLPEEILERIFLFTSQYRDYKRISLVCSKWMRIIKGLCVLNRARFNECFQNGQINWTCFSSLKNAPTQRHSHSSIVLRDKLYIFGGLSATNTSYNDLWTLDLSTREWSRPLAGGNYPSPKAAASLLSHKNDQYLLLYGGYSHPYSYPFNQQVNFFDEMHLYCTQTSYWTQILFAHDAPKLAGHSASIVDNRMLLVGGCNASLGNKTNAVHCFDLNDREWLHNERIKIDGFRPEPRYGHSQFTLDNQRVLIVGGCGGPGKQYDDVWILHWPKYADTQNARWEKICTENYVNSPMQAYCLPFVKCENKLITFGKPRDTQSLNENTSLAFNSHANSASQLALLNYYEYLNSPALNIASFKNGDIVHRKCTCFSYKEENRSDSKSIGHVKSLENKTEAKSDQTSNSSGSVSNKNSEDAQLSLLNKAQLKTIKRLETLKKLATKFKDTSSPRNEDAHILEQLNSTTNLKKAQNFCVLHTKAMQLFILDIGELLETNKNSHLRAKWQTPIAPHFHQSPADTILFSFCKGTDELLVFGGMELLDSPLFHIKPASYEQMKQNVSNKLYIMRPNFFFNSNKTNK